MDGGGSVMTESLHGVSNQKAETELETDPVYELQRLILGNLQVKPCLHSIAFNIVPQARGKKHLKHESTGNISDSSHNTIHIRHILILKPVNL